MIMYPGIQYTQLAWVGSSKGTIEEDEIYLLQERSPTEVTEIGQKQPRQRGNGGATPPVFERSAAFCGGVPGRWWGGFGRGGGGEAFS